MILIFSFIGQGTNAFELSPVISNDSVTDDPATPDQIIQTVSGRIPSSEISTNDSALQPAILKTFDGSILLLLIQPLFTI